MKQKQENTEEKTRGTLPEGRKRAAAVLGCAALALLFFFAGWYGRWFALGERARSLLWAVDTAEKNYYWGVTEDELYSRLYDVFALDPYSRYYTEEEYAEVLAAGEGEENDFGISVSKIETNGKIRIYSVTGNSSAERAGVLPGMYIYRYGAEEDELSEGTAEELVSFASSAHEGMYLECGFSQEGTDATLYFVQSAPYLVSECLYRDSGEGVRYDVQTKTFRSSPAGALPSLPGEYGYLRLGRFYGHAAEETAACLARMKERGRTNLILDLRGNGGGYMSVLRAVAAYFLRDAEEKRPVVAEVRYKSGKREVYRAPSNRFSEYFSPDARIVILADENTASASECLIGALVSYGTVGYEDIFLRAQNGAAKTYGKGIMQSHYSDANGNVLKLTSAGVYWPNGTTIHGKGVTAEDGAVAIEAPVLPSEQDEMLERAIAMLA